MNDVIRDIVNAINSEILAELGSSYAVLPYLENVEKNNTNTNHDRYGTRALGASQLPGVTKYVTFTQSFEVVLTKGYAETSIDDNNQVSASLDNRANMLDIYKRLVNNKAGLPLVVLNVFGLDIDEPEYITESKVAIQRARMDVTYRFSLI